MGEEQGPVVAAELQQACFLEAPTGKVLVAKVAGGRAESPSDVQRLSLSGDRLLVVFVSGTQRRCLCPTSLRYCRFLVTRSGPRFTSPFRLLLHRLPSACHYRPCVVLCDVFDRPCVVLCDVFDRLCDVFDGLCDVVQWR